MIFNKLLKGFKLWWQGKYTPGHDYLGVITFGYRKYPALRVIFEEIRIHLKKDWKFWVMPCIAIIGLYIAFLNLK